MDHQPSCPCHFSVQWDIEAVVDLEILVAPLCSRPPVVSWPAPHYVTEGQYLNTQHCPATHLLCKLLVPPEMFLLELLPLLVPLPGLRVPLVQGHRQQVVAVRVGTDRS